jgi:hypothetical protein
MKKILILLFIGISYLNAQKTSTPFFPVFDKNTKSWYFIDKNGKKSVRVQEKNISEVHPIFSNRALAKDSVKNKWGYLDIAILATEGS